MLEDDGRPVLSFLTSHWLSTLGALLVTAAGCSWLLVLPSQIRGHATNPYIGIVLFIVLPIVFALGLIMMPIGLWLSRRAARQHPQKVITRKASLRRLATFLIVATVLNIVIMSHLTYSAVEYMEGTQFCGQSCHVMKPAFTAHRTSPHARVLCVECHVAPGATGWIESKLAGTRQLMEVAFNTYPRPIKSAMETNRLVATSGTCETCHWPEQAIAARLRIIPEYADDEKNTRSQTVLLMMVGGGSLRGIHGAHLGPGISIRYASTDSTRQTIQWVQYKNSSTNQVKTYTVDGFKTGDTAKLSHYSMQCVDCHNRPAHTFQLPERAVNRAMALGKIAVSLPFIKKKAVEALKAEYSSNDDAAIKIPAVIRDYYRTSHQAVHQSRAADIEATAKAIAAIYEENVFSDLKVTWGTYQNNLGHTDYPGCFRCHDDAHTSSENATITQDCSACHELLATSESSPEVLKTLRLDEKLLRMQKE